MAKVSIVVNGNSKKYSVNNKDIKKIGKGAGIAVSGALLVYLLQVLPLIDFGQSTPLIVAVCGILINAGLKYVTGKK